MGLPIPGQDKGKEKKSGSLPIPPPSAAGDKKEKKGLPVPPKPSSPPAQKPSGGLGAALPTPAPGLPKEPSAPRTGASGSASEEPPQPQKRKRGTGLPKPPMSASETISGLPSLPRDRKRRGNALPTRNGRAIIPQRGSLPGSDGASGADSSGGGGSPLSRVVKASGRDGAANSLSAAAETDEDFEYTDPMEDATDDPGTDTADSADADTDADAPFVADDTDDELLSVDDLVEELGFNDDTPDEDLAVRGSEEYSEEDADESYEDDADEDQESPEIEGALPVDDEDSDDTADDANTSPEDDDDSYLREMFFSDSDIDIDELFDDSPSAEDLYGDSSARNAVAEDSADGDYDDSSAHDEYAEGSSEAADDDYYWDDEDAADPPQPEGDYGSGFDSSEFDIDDLDNTDDVDDYGYGYDGDEAPEDDEGNESEDKPKKKPKKEKKPKKKSSAAGAAGAVKKAFESYYKWLMSLIRALGRLPVIGKPFRLLANAERVLRLLSPLFPILIPLLIWVLINMFYPSNEHTVDDLPDEGAASAVVESYDPESNTAVVNIENTGEIILDVSAHVQIYSTQFGLNPVTWILPQPATTCRTDWTLVEQADIETVQAQCESTDAGGFWFRGSVEEILE